MIAAGYYPPVSIDQVFKILQGDIQWILPDPLFSFILFAHGGIP